MKPATPIRLAVLLLACTSIASSLALAENPAEWSRFRGANGSGLSDADIPAQWTDKDFNWKTTLPGGGHSSPIVWKDRIFLTCCNDQTGERSVVCVNAGDGSIRWIKRYPGSPYHLHQYNSYASGSACADERHVYYCWITPEELCVAALDHDGNEIWKRSLGEFASQHGAGQSPMVFQDRVIVTNDNEGPESSLFALHRDTGAILWKVPRGHSDKFCASTPCVFQPKEGQPELIFTSKAHGFTAIDPQNGRVIWELNKVFDARAISSPYIADGLIFGSCGDGGIGHQFAAIKPSDDGQSAQVQYLFKKTVPYVPTSIVKNGLLFYVTDNGVMRCLKASSGDVIWSHRMDGNFFGSLVCAKDKIFMLSKEGDAYVVAATDHFELLARNPLKLEDSEEHQLLLSSTPAIVGGRMYIRTYTHLVSIGGPH